ncbi:MAG: hypothetical protein Q9216_004511 [Gyalolechia sp. 2 TL-2023]
MCDHLNEIKFDQVPLYCDLFDTSSDVHECSVRKFSDFVSLPETLGWSIRENGDKEPLADPAPANLDKVTQRWLYFEVLAQVFGHLPDYEWEQFLRSDQSGQQYITTEKLPEYLEKWSDSEKNSQPVESKNRLIRIHQVLDKAQAYVSQHCAVRSLEEKARWEVNDLLVLTFMVLGETLTRALSLIQRRLEFRIEGWCGYELPSQGWGCGKYILQKLKEAQWCDKAVYMQQDLLKGNSIGLLYLLELRDSGSKGPNHIECTATQCQEMELRQIRGRLPKPYHYCEATFNFGSEPEYVNGQLLRPPQRGTDEDVPCNVEGQELADIINKGKIPLFQYHRGRHKLKLCAMDQSFDKSYAIFSHVWTDGFGSLDLKNRMNPCVLYMLSLMLERVTTLRAGNRSPVPEYFWIDTLAIPLEDKFAKERGKAIKQMHNIYVRAKYTIVLDLSLMQANIGRGYSSPAMKITMSRWMTRLWTLQEAALSKNLFIVFRDRILPLNQLEDMFPDEDSELHSCIPSLARVYYAGILGSIRAKIHLEFRKNEGWSPEMDDVAAIWKAAQWRTTAHPIHETLALATMLRLDTEYFSRKAQSDEGTDAYRQECDTRMVELLSRLGAKPNCPIPPGMIFLAGPRLSQKGFGWAPRSWLSSHEIDPPDPLSRPSLGNTRLNRGNGLEVEYPGFLLHDLAEDRKKLYTGEEFYFSSESALSEWYRLEPARHTENFPEAQIDSTLDLAIITSRLPVEKLKEIALFVAIRDDYGGMRYVEILNQVWICREKRPEQMQDWSKKHSEGDPEALTAGEKLPPTTKWCVDGPSQAGSTLDMKHEGAQARDQSDFQDDEAEGEEGLEAPKRSRTMGFLPPGRTWSKVFKKSQNATHKAIKAYRG